MPASEKWLSERASRAKQLEQLGVFWYHDGNPKRPYVRLRSGLISNGYFNGAVLSELPAHLDAFAEELVHQYLFRTGAAIGVAAPKTIANRIVGPAMGAITLAHAVAAKYYGAIRDCGFSSSSFVTRTSFAEKDGDDFTFKRSKPLQNERVLLVEDTITTGGSILKVRDAVLKAAPTAIIEPYLLSLCNRSGKDTLDGLEIVSLVDGDFKAWNEGENPFTGGEELVPDVKNAKDNWGLLTQAYA